MGWLSDLPYPWCRPEEAIRNMPKFKGLAEIGNYITRGG